VTEGTVSLQVPEPTAREERDWRAIYVPSVDETLDRAAPGSDDELRVWRPWWNAFLTALTRTGTLAASARAAGVDVAMPKRDRKRFEHFRLAVHDALEEAWDLLEQVAFVRATAGERVEFTVTREEFDAAGKLVARVVTTTQKQRTSDALLARLLMANRPEKYSERHDFRHGGLAGDATPVVLEVKRTPERIAALIDAMREAGLIPECLPPVELEVSA